MGVPIVTNHLHTNIDAEVDRRYRINGNIRGKNGRLDIKEIRNRNIHVPDCSSVSPCMQRVLRSEEGTDVDNQ